MAFKDVNGKITIDEKAAADDIAKIRGAQQLLEDSQKAAKALIDNAYSCYGETAEAIGAKGTEILNEISSLYNNLTETIRYIQRVVEIYRIKDKKLKEMMLAKTNRRGLWGE